MFQCGKGLNSDLRMVGNEIVFSHNYQLVWAKFCLQFQSESISYSAVSTDHHSLLLLSTVVRATK